MGEMSPHVKLALESINAYVTTREIIVPPDEITPALCTRAGAFVCIKKFGELRGCIGSIEPVQPTLAHEIIRNAIGAATTDPRFLPVEPEELELLVCSVDVLACPEPVDEMCQLDPKRYGVIVQCEFSRGLLLPDLEGVDTAEDQVSIACSKAGIRPGMPIQLYRFEVNRFH